MEQARPTVTLFKRDGISGKIRIEAGTKYTYGYENERRNA
jgi:hypothetical protein